MKNRTWLIVALVAAGCGTEPDPIVPSRLPDAAVPLPEDAAPVADAAPGSPDAALPDDAAAELPRSGTRIRQMIGTTPDGVRTFYGWYDSQLGVNCYFGQAEHGKTRCLPLDTASVNLNRFTDTACTRPLADDYRGCAKAYGISTKPATDGTCGAYDLQVWALTPYEGTIYLVSSSGQCVATTPEPAGYALFSATELPLSTFQEMTVSIE